MLSKKSIAKFLLFQIGTCLYLLLDVLEFMKLMRAVQCLSHRQAWFICYGSLASVTRTALDFEKQNYAFLSFFFYRASYKMFKNRSNESHTHTNWVEILFKVMRNEAEKGKFLEIITQVLDACSALQRKKMLL